MSDQVKAFRQPGVRRSRQVKLDYLLRNFACLLVLGLHISLFYDAGRSLFWVYVIIHTLIYPHIVYFLTYTIEEEKRNILLDTFFYGTCFAIWGFNPYLVFAFLIGLTMTNLAAGGVRFLIFSLLFLLVGVALGMQFNGVYFRPELPLTATLMMSFGLFVYTLSLGYVAYYMNQTLLKTKGDLSQQREQLLGINSLAQAVNSFLDIDMIMEHVFRVIRKRYAFDHIYLLTTDEDGNSISKINGYGKHLTKEEREAISRISCSIDKNASSVFVIPLLKQKPIYIPQIEEDKLVLADEFDQQVYRIKKSISVAIFPLRVRKKVIGCISLVSAEKRVDLKPEDLETIDTILFQVGTAVYNARMYEESKVASARAREAQHRAENSEEAKGRFLANMSHEIRTPMTSIIGYSEALLDEDLLEEERKRFVNTIIRSGHHLLSVINDILDLSKMDADKLETEKIAVNLPQLIEDLRSTIGLKVHEKGLAFSVNTLFPLPLVFYSDPTRLKQIMFNLANNSVKFTARGKIELSIFYDSRNNSLVFEIMDTGIGLTPDQQKHLFRPFSQADSTTTRQYGGTGLGLFISRQLAQLLGGTIRVKSEFGKGSTFSVSVNPGDLEDTDWLASESQWQTAVKSASQHSQDFSVPQFSGTVLVAEDNRDTQLLIERVLRKSGVKAVIVSNGKQAVERVKTDPFDLVLLDVQMPVMGGEEAAQLIRKSHPDLPLIAFTANVMQHQLDAYIRCGFNSFVSKPINRSEFYRALGSFLNKKKLKLAGRVLLAEDNVVNSKLIIRHIQKISELVDVVHVENGQAALDALAARDFDLVLMDMEMPVLSGDEAVKSLRRRGVQTPVWMFTGNTDVDFQRKFKEIGAQGFLAKPIEKGKLVAVLTQCLKA